MRDLSLHLLDLAENAVRAGARVIEVMLSIDPSKNRMKLSVEDDGPGIDMPLEEAADPFFTTKSGKKTGLGLALFRAAAERAGGRMWIGRSALGGAAVGAEMQTDHIDLAPLGDFGGTIASIAMTCPGMDLRFRARGPGLERTVRLADAPRGPDGPDPIAAAAWMEKQVAAAVAEISADGRG
jgi:hypothetical protein